MYYFCWTKFHDMKRICAFLTVLLFFTTVSAQEMVFTPVPYKNAPAEATLYLKNLKMKAKKAKWSLSPNGVYMADFQKKKVSKTAYYFSSDGRMLYKRTPSQESDLPTGVQESAAGRMQAPGTKLFLFSNDQEKYYAISILQGPDTYVTRYFTADGRVHEMRFK